MMLAIARIQVPGLHAWGHQPNTEPRRYLGNQHRHVFHVEAAVRVTHYDRDVEILELGHAVSQCLRQQFNVLDTGELDFGSQSCEQLALFITQVVTRYDFEYIRVLEDNENGAEWRRD